MTNTNANNNDKPNSIDHVNNNENCCDRLFAMHCLQHVICNVLFGLNYLN